MNHWQRTDPDRYAAIPDRQAFFAALGERAESEIQQLQDSLAGPDRPQESYLQKVGRLNMARLAAEEHVLRETLLISEPWSREEDQEGPAGTVEFMRDLSQAMRETGEDEPRPLRFAPGSQEDLVLSGARAR